MVLRVGAPEEEGGVADFSLRNVYVRYNLGLEGRPQLGGVAERAVFIFEDQENTQSLGTCTYSRVRDSTRGKLCLVFQVFWFS